MRHSKFCVSKMDSKHSLYRDKKSNNMQLKQVVLSLCGVACRRHYCSDVVAVVCHVHGWWRLRAWFDSLMTDETLVTR